MWTRNSHGSCSCGPLSFACRSRTNLKFSSGPDLHHAVRQRALGADLVPAVVVDQPAGCPTPRRRRRRVRRGPSPRPGRAFQRSRNTAIAGGRVIVGRVDGGEERLLRFRICAQELEERSGVVTEARFENLAVSGLEVGRERLADVLVLALRECLVGELPVGVSTRSRRNLSASSADCGATF